MAVLYPAQDIHDAIAAAQAKANAAPVKDGDNDDETIKPRPRSGISTATKSFDTEIFEGFSHFELDLSCLSRPASPAPSSCYHLPPSTPSPPPSPPPPVQHTLSRTKSFAQQAIAPLKKTTKKLSSAHLSSMTMPPGSSRGSWPGVKYTGRGTPIDRSRNREWGGFITEEDEVAEDGVLFSSLRSASLDSHVRPSQKSMSSPQWSYLPPLLSATPSRSASAVDDEQTEGAESVVEPPPELAPLNIGADQAEDWGSIMRSVLGSKEPKASSSTPDSAEEAYSAQDGNQTHGEEPVAQGDEGNHRPTAPPVDFPMMTPDQIEELHSGLESHLGIHQALDLGLGIGISEGAGGRGMNLFKLGLLPSSESGRETPSIYSQAETPRGSRAPTVVFHEQLHQPDDSDQRSVTTATAPPQGVRADGVKSDNHPWWRKVLRGMRKIQDSINTQKRRMH